MTGAKGWFEKSGVRDGGCCGGDGFTSGDKIVVFSSFCFLASSNSIPLTHPPSSPPFSAILFSPPPFQKPKSFRLQEMLLCPPLLPRSKERTRKHFWDASFPLPPSTNAAVALAVASHAFPPFLPHLRRSLIHLDQVEEVPSSC